ncbi:Uncharacterized conserved protein, contains GH25 family domain [Hymenobacter daecheongensis DSM 21074]|uniref:Uncharacterized conserved protein, contains GH25 family domain n=1 Tax=Hymenobacter daecheongensis DSM 21074 TaxID=1121955 RepID=A0A1M6KW52_9BACT|nr:DUF4198 domain-containing protein [Hymenobacter daecheongensis]SHJ63133.1 Uncharacterized conserved protein, contains GH25 family domain [Hymenobacter daecheongensis DSM 21074]
MPPLFRCLLLLLCATIGVSTGLASEFWLLPARFVVAPGTRLHIRVLVGDNFSGTRWAGQSSRLTRFVHYTPTDSTDLTPTARQTDTLNTAVTFSQPGLHLLAFSTSAAVTVMEAGKFNAYLQAAGLEEALALRRQRQELAQPGREAYRRCAKTLLQVGAASADTARIYARVAGLPLELVPEQNPYTLKPGASLTLRVLAAGQPVRGALVQLWQRPPGQPMQVIRARSNQNGRVLFRLAGASSYLVSTVRMVPAPDAKTADWQSTWATLTFGGPGISGR